MVILVVILANSSLRCKKDDHQNKIQYDLFPLKVGNEYYYKHSYSWINMFEGYDSVGIEKWTVLTGSKNYNNDIEYLIEKKFNGIYVNWSTLQSKAHRDTTFNIDKTSHFIITEKPSGEILFQVNLPSSGVSIPRHFDKPDTTIRIWTGADHSETYYFKAGLGLKEYYKIWGLMGHQITESLIQDGVKISK
jgi:hypothetical protein